MQAFKDYAKKERSDYVLDQILSKNGDKLHKFEIKTDKETE